MRRRCRLDVTRWTRLDDGGSGTRPSEELITIWIQAVNSTVLNSTHFPQLTLNQLTLIWPNSSSTQLLWPNSLSTQLLLCYFLNSAHNSSCRISLIDPLEIVSQFDITKVVRNPPPIEYATYHSNGYALCRQDGVCSRACSLSIISRITISTHYQWGESWHHQIRGVC